MVFSSPVFLFLFLPVALGLYFIVPKRAKNGLLFGLSLLFYGWGEPTYVLIMLISLTAAYALGFPIARLRKRRPRAAKRLTVLSVCLTLGWLIFFKYTHFIAETAGQLLSLFPQVSFTTSALPALALPIGISFYTFQILTYSVDLYRGDIPLQRNFIDFGLYIALFPQLIAGPIVRYSDIRRQLSERRVTATGLSEGIRRFIIGFGKKVLLGDLLASLCAYYKSALALEPSTTACWMILISFSLHIYFDFSGYSDMAIGLGRMFGFSFPENFNYPYMATSITDFWRRWHITLSTWFREYVYIPLGGNRVNAVKRWRNLAAVWLLTGLWHGASWNFVLWGAFFLLFLILEKSFLLSRLGRHPIIGRVYALLVVGVAWMLFDNTDLSTAGTIIGGLVGIGMPASSTALTLYELQKALPLLIAGTIAATPFPSKLATGLRRHTLWCYAEPALLLLLFTINVAYTVSTDYSPFLYFNF